MQVTSRITRELLARGSALFIGLRTRSQALSYSTGAQGTEKRVSPHISFYQQHGRAVAKVFLMSFLVYQGIYWSWMKLETMELKENRGREIAQLEDEVRAAQAAAQSHQADQSKR